jgi:hypothetical protein
MARTKIDVSLINNISSTLNMGGNKISNLANGTTATDASAWGQLKVDLLGTAVASSSASISFTSLAGGSYSEFFVVIGNLNAANAGVFLTMQLSTGSGFITTNYSDAQYRIIQSGGSGGGGASSASSWQIGIYTEALGTGSHYYGKVSIPNPDGSNATKCMIYQASATSSNGANFVTFSGGGTGSFNSSVVDGIRFQMSSGNISNGNFYLYGVRNS